MNESLPESKPPIEMAAFQALDLRTGVVTSCVKHPSADRLLVLTVDLGEAQPRTIVAGLAAYYADPHALVGRTVVVVANLAPAVLRGVRSEGMVLAAGGKNHRGVVTVAEACPPGELVR
jgi:methionyl-tRNA synthetase